MKILKIAVDDHVMKRLIRMIEDNFDHYGYKVWEEEE